MKKTLIALVALASSLGANANIWLDLGAKVGYGPGVFYNSHILDSKVQSLRYSHGYIFGGKFGINFGHTYAITSEFLVTQTTQTLYNNTTTASNILTVGSFDVPIMFRVNQENGGYGEIGPMFSFTQKGKLSVAGTSFIDVKNRFNSQNMGIAFGFGQYIGGGDAFGFDMGFRFGYMFSDIVGSNAQNLLLDPVYQPALAELPDYEYKASNRIYAAIALEFTFNLGYFITGPVCSKRTRFRMF